jgi:hypothetical protein
MEFGSTGGRDSASLRASGGIEALGVPQALLTGVVQPWPQPIPVEQCARNAIGADRARRAAPLPPPLRQLHRAILRRFATTGTTPTRAEIDPAARATGRRPRWDDIFATLLA